MDIKPTTPTPAPAQPDRPQEDIQNKLPEGAFEEKGKSGTFLFYGYITAEEYNANLIGKRGLEQYDIMRRSDPTVHAVLLVVKNPIIGATWDVEPASEEQADIDTADFVKQELFDRKIMWQDTVREGLSCLEFGHCVFEVVYEPTAFNGAMRIGLAKLATRKQRSIMKWNTNDDQPGITQVTPTGGLIEIPRNKLVYVVNEQEGENYEGISLLRFAYKPWKIKDSLEIMNAIALERMSLGIPIVKKGINNETVSQPEITKIEDALRQMRNNEEAYLSIPASVSIEMLDMKANSTKDILPTIQYQDRQITLSVLAQFLELGASGGSSGSRAVSADHSQLFIKSLDAVARIIQQAFQRDIVNSLVDLNYSKLPNGYPKLTFSNIDDADTTALSTSIASLVTAGALTPDAEMENRIRNILNLPELPDDIYDNYEEAKAPPVPPPANPADPAAKPQTPNEAKAIAQAKLSQRRLLSAILKRV